MKTHEFTTRRRDELLQVAKRRPGFSCQGPLGEFLDDYLVAESLLRRLINYYVSDTSSSVASKLDTRQINAALKHFNLNVMPSDVTEAFKGGSGKRGFKSARQLRNGFLHDLSPEDGDEVIARFSQIKELVSRVVQPVLAAASGA